MSAEILTLLFGVVGILVTIVGGGATILFISLSTIRTAKRESDDAIQLHRSEVIARIEAVRLEVQERLEAIRRELSEKIEALRIETKNDRHNYVEQIDNVLKELHEDISKLETGMAVLVSRADTIVALKSIVQGEN